MNLSEALALADEAHKGQKYGYQSYMEGHIYPVVAVAIHDNAGAANIADIAVAAALHDTVEDTFLTLHGLRELGASEAVVRAVDSVTRREGETYMDMIRRARVDPVGCLVKLADNTCNLHESMLRGPESLVRRYERARTLLSSPVYYVGG